MIAMYVVFDISGLPPMSPGQFQASVKSFVDGVPFFPGLRSKYFIFDPETKELGGIYLLDDGADLDSYWKSDYWKGAVEMLGKPAIRTYQVVGFVHAGERQVLAGNKE